MGGWGIRVMFFSQMRQNLMICKREQPISGLHLLSHRPQGLPTPNNLPTLIPIHPPSCPKINLPQANPEDK